MAKTIKTGIPTIGVKEKSFTGELKFDIPREKLEGMSRDDIIKSIEGQARSWLNRFIGVAITKAEQWAGETVAEEKFLKNDQ